VTAFTGVTAGIAAGITATVELRHLAIPLAPPVTRATKKLKLYLRG
jgi:hypothetical protein